MKKLVPSVWTVRDCKGLPKHCDPNESAVLMCLNIASFAFRSPTEHDKANDYEGTFAYEAKANFLHKARHYIAMVAGKRIDLNMFILAEIRIEDDI